jgi:hypothetical protein
MKFLLQITAKQLASGAFAALLAAPEGVSIG